jgi:hypothetical protein
MFEKLWGMLQELESAKGSKAKTALLQKFVGDKDFIWMVKMALDQGHSFGIENFPAYAEYVSSADGEMILALEDLKTLSGVNDAKASQIYHMMCSSEARYNVVSRILRKDLRCGVAAKTINKVVPGLVFRVSYQRCATADHVDKIKYKPGAILQLKANCMFAYLLPDGSFMTRKGERCSIPGNPVSSFVAGLPGLNDKVLACEIGIVGNDGKFLNRAESNGLINAFFKGGGDTSLISRIRAYTWLYLTKEEFLNGEGKVPYRYMWDDLVNRLPPINTPILPIPSWYVRSLDEARAKTNELIQLGEEGAVLKSMSDEFLWRDEDPSFFQVKLKAESDAEFEIISTYEGDPKKKYAGMLGGIRVRSSDGVIVTDCGGGFTDAQRKQGCEHWNSLVGKIVTIKFNGVTLPNEDGKCALDHPRFIEVRYDKVEADSSEYCKNSILGVANGETN